MFKGKIPTILIADDDEQALSVLKQIIVNQGYKVIEASDGFMAKEKIKTHMPDLIILDNYMIGPSGIVICHSIKSDPLTRLIPVIMLTGYTESINKIEAIESGVDDFVSKPFKTLELTTRIRSLLKAKFLNEELDSAEGIIFALARAIEAKDNYTQGHTERVSHFAVMLGQKLGLSNEEQNALYKGGILHDIGKIGVPDAILNKHGRLTDEEFSTIRIHSDRGEKICQPLNSMKSALKIIRHHHEKLDGSGYPDGLSGNDIPVVARIMAIVDVYDALTTERAYRPEFTIEAAFKIMETEVKQGWWDGNIVECFQEIIKQKHHTEPRKQDEHKQDEHPKEQDTKKKNKDNIINPLQEGYVFNLNLLD